MIRRIVAFGDSYIFGEELPYDDDVCRPMVEELVGWLPRDHTGAILEDGITQQLIARKKAMDLLIDGYDERCVSMSFPGYMASIIGTEYQNHAFGGYSNDAIMSTLLMNRAEIDADTLVIVGLTYHTRRTRLGESKSNGRIRCINNYHAETGDQMRYLELEDAYGDDLLVRYLHVRNTICAIRQLLEGIPHIVLDPVNTYRENPELNGRLFAWDHDRCVHRALERNGRIERPSLANEIQAYFNHHTFHYTLVHAMADVMATDGTCRHPFMHPTRRVHERFADAYVMPWLTERGML